MITQKQMQASLSSTQHTLDGCYIAIGKLVSERDCTEEEAKQRIEENKQNIRYFKGYLEALKYVMLFSPELALENTSHEEAKP